MPTEQAQKFIDWFKGQHLIALRDPVYMSTLGHYAETPVGREWIAKSYLHAVWNRLEVLQNEDGVKEVIFSIETLLKCYLQDERSSIPVDTLQTILDGLRSPRPEEVQVYTGPRPTRFERLLNED